MARLDATRTRAILERCREEGFALAGVCSCAPSERAEEYGRWIDEGRHGSMAYMERNVEARLDPGVFVEGARSLVIVADQYWSRNASGDETRDGFGRVARYARGDDYHKEMKRRLHAVCDWIRERHGDVLLRAFVDTAPVLEREHALRAGLGWIGKHTLLIHPARGSYLFLGGIATELELYAAGERVADHCGTCTRCIDACPTGAITPYSVDGSRCISELTIERRGAIPGEFHEAIGDWLYGCDICQEVCPHNSAREDGVDVGAARDAYSMRRSGFDLLEVLGWNEEDRREAFTRSAMKRATLAMMRRNALIVAGNSLREREDDALRETIERASDDEETLVRETAREVLDQLEARS
ncbi:MAG: tRNA epoxyqueuosine(34) reductase QueG [Phycisphaerales bacterium JB043]